MKRNIAIVGLGYVGLPVAVAFGKKGKVIGFDISEKRVETLKKGIDYTNEVEKSELVEADIEYTSDASSLVKADFIIVSVPTPINKHNQPDLTPLRKASETVGSNMRKGSIVVYESTVYPGVTEDECIPILEKTSGLINGKDFFVGYSPERINPGDKVHSFTNIVKVVSGQNDEVLDIVAEVYASVVSAGVHKASSIKVAEAAKVIENTQRDVNIALMNELSLIFDLIDIETSEVLAASSTKWNFLNFSPGLVGGHCIGVDPYYLTHMAQAVGYNPEIILAGRRINDSMSERVVDKLVKSLFKLDKRHSEIIITVLGVTFKENVPDIRNSKTLDIISELDNFGIKVQISDYQVKEDLNINDKVFINHEINNLNKADVVILASPHKEYLNKEYLNFADLVNDKTGLIFDVKSVLDKNELSKNYTYLSL